MPPGFEPRAAEVRRPERGPGALRPPPVVRTFCGGPLSPVHCQLPTSQRPLSTSDPIIQFLRVSKTFGAPSAPVRAVDAVSFEIRRGEFFSLLGPSGCGKTTTLRVLAGFE